MQVGGIELRVQINPHTHTHTHSQLTLTRAPRPFSGERVISLTRGAETTVYPHAKRGSGTLPQTMHKVKMDRRPECES